MFRKQIGSLVYIVRKQIGSLLYILIAWPAAGSSSLDHSIAQSKKRYLAAAHPSNLAVLLLVITEKLQCESTTPSSET